MSPVDVATRRKRIVVILALVSTCIFGRMSVVATADAFENATLTTFEQLAWVWNLLRWFVPALLIGIWFDQGVALVSASVNLISGFVLLALGISGFVPIGSYIPDSTYFGGAAAELGTSVIIAAVAAFAVRTGYRLIATRLTPQQSTRPYE